MHTFVFPGQGSQIKGMGINLFDEFPALIKQADEILGYSIKTLCLEDLDQQLNQTQYTQPALYVVNALTYFKKLQETSLKPDFVTGHSLGEYNALLAAEVFDFATGLQLVKKRGELMSQAREGGMAALIGLDTNSLEEIIQKNHLNDIAISNYNSYTQFVISGKMTGITQAESFFKTIPSVTFIPLRVSGAFHSLHMLFAQREFSVFIDRFSFAVPTIPVIANITATPYHPAVIKSHLIQQITQPVQWMNCIKYLLEQGEIFFTESGPGNVLTKLIERIKNNR